MKIDPPGGRLVSVPKDMSTHCRAEVCFGQRAGALLFTLLSLPLPRRGSVRSFRFAVGERVACAVEDETDDFSVWAAGTVEEVSVSLATDAHAIFPERDWSGANGTVPYRVKLDSGTSVLCHRDEHWLIRDLKLQAEGARVAADGTRCLARLETRARGEGVWEMVDHATRRVRVAAAPEEDDEEEEDID